MPSHSKASCQGTAIPQTGDCHAALITSDPDNPFLYLEAVCIYDTYDLARIALCRAVYGMSIEEAINNLLGATRTPEPQHRLPL